MLTERAEARDSATAALQSIVDKLERDLKRGNREALVHHLHSYMAARMELEEAGLPNQRAVREIEIVMAASEYYRSQRAAADPAGA